MKKRKIKRYNGVKDKGCDDLATAIENGDYDDIKFKQLTSEDFDNIVEALLFSSERVGIEVVIE